MRKDGGHHFAIWGVPGERSRSRGGRFVECRQINTGPMTADCMARNLTMAKGGVRKWTRAEVGTRLGHSGGSSRHSRGFCCIAPPNREPTGRRSCGRGFDWGMAPSADIVQYELHTVLRKFNRAIFLKADIRCAWYTCVKKPVGAFKLCNRSSLVPVRMCPEMKTP